MKLAAYCNGSNNGTNRPPSPLATTNSPWLISDLKTTRCFVVCTPMFISQVSLRYIICQARLATVFIFKARNLLLKLLKEFNCSKHRTNC